MDEIIKTLHLTVSNETVRKTVRNWAIAARRSLFMPVNRSVPDVAQKRKSRNDLMSGFKVSDLVFQDESGCNTDMRSLDGIWKMIYCLL